MDILSFLNLGGQEIIVIFFILLPFLLFLTALVQCLTAKFAESTDKLIWILVILLLPAIGPILWFHHRKEQNHQSLMNTPLHSMLDSAPVLALIAIALLQIFAVVQCLKSHFVEPVDKIAWLLAIFLIPIIGPLLWIFMDQRTEEQK